MQQQRPSRQRLSGQTPAQAEFRRRVTDTAIAIRGAVYAAREAYRRANPRHGQPSDQVLAVAVGRLLSLRLKAEPDTPGFTYTEDTLRVLGTPTLVARWLHPYGWKVMLRVGTAWEEVADGELPGPHPVFVERPQPRPVAGVRRIGRYRR